MFKRRYLHGVRSGIRTHALILFEIYSSVKAFCAQQGDRPIGLGRAPGLVWLLKRLTVPQHWPIYLMVGLVINYNVGTFLLLNQASDNYFVKYLISKYLFSFLEGNNQCSNENKTKSKIALTLLLLVPFSYKLMHHLKPFAIVVLNGEITVYSVDSPDGFEW